VEVHLHSSSYHKMDVYNEVLWSASLAHSVASMERQSEYPNRETDVADFSNIHVAMQSVEQLQPKPPQLLCCAIMCFARALCKIGIKSEVYWVPGHTPASL